NKRFPGSDDLIRCRRILWIARKVATKYFEEVRHAVAICVFFRDGLNSADDISLLARPGQLFLHGSEALAERIVRLVPRDPGFWRIGQVAERAIVEFLGQERSEMLGDGLLVGGSGVCDQWSEQ